MHDFEIDAFHEGVHEVHLPVTNINRSIDFYTKKLGFELAFGKRNDPSVLLLYSKANRRWMLGLFEVDHIEHRHPAEYHVAFKVSEVHVDHMITFLHNQGIQPLHPSTVPDLGGQEMKEPIVHGWMPAAAVFFRDPDGHLLELIAYLEENPDPNFNYRPLSEWRARSN
ncbi:MAG: VOC family protein [Balneolaceae bacterium]|jgi:lactoylglutathione lyase